MTRCYTNPHLPYRLQWRWKF